MLLMPHKNKIPKSKHVKPDKDVHKIKATNDDMYEDHLVLFHLLSYLLLISREKTHLQVLVKTHCEALKRLCRRHIFLKKTKIKYGWKSHVSAYVCRSGMTPELPKLLANGHGDLNTAWYIFFLLFLWMGSQQISKMERRKHTRQSLLVLCLESPSFSQQLSLEHRPSGAILLWSSEKHVTQTTGLERKSEKQEGSPICSVSLQKKVTVLITVKRFF